MNPHVMQFFAVLLAVLFSNVAAAQTRVVGYYPSWGMERAGYPVSKIPGELLTHIQYAFAKISPTGELVLGSPDEDIQREYPGPTMYANGQAVDGHIGALLRLRQRFPHLKIVISVGGWDWSGGFSKTASTEERRKRFTQSCLDFLRRFELDGIDIDWEFPVSGGQFPATGHPSDRANATLLLRELRRGLDFLEKRMNRKYELTIAVPAGKENLQHFDLASIHGDLDCIYLMAYDLWGSWSSQTAFHAPLSSGADEPDSVSGRNVKDVVAEMIADGVPRKKIVVGVPFFGRGVVGVAPASQGLYQRHGGAAKGTWGDEMYDYADLLKNYFERYPCFWDTEAKAGWLYAKERGGLMISFEDRRSVGLKADYVREQSLGGMMIWDLTMDAPGEDSLLRTMATRLKRGRLESRQPGDRDGNRVDEQ